MSGNQLYGLKSKCLCNEWKNKLTVENKLSFGKGQDQVQIQRLPISTLCLGKLFNLEFLLCDMGTVQVRRTVGLCTDSTR